MKLYPVRMQQELAGDFRKIGLLIESVNDNLLRLAESHELLVDRCNRLQRTVDDHTEMIGQLVVETHITQERLGNLDITPASRVSACCTRMRNQPSRNEAEHEVATTATPTEECSE